MNWAVYGKLSHRYEEFATRKEAMEWLKKVKKLDQEQGFKDTWEILKLY